MTVKQCLSGSGGSASSPYLVLVTGAGSAPEFEGGAMRVLVCGGRDYAESSVIWGVLDELRRQNGALIIIEGGATGADTIAREWWRARAVGECITVRADWKRHGKAAGPIRNQLMIDHYKPELVVAAPGGRGTDDMVRRAIAAGIPVKRL